MREVGITGSGVAIGPSGKIWLVGPKIGYFFEKFSTWFGLEIWERRSADFRVSGPVQRSRRRVEEISISPATKWTHTHP